MIDADERLIQGKRDSLRGLETNQQGGGQSRPLRGRHGVELLRGNASLMNRLLSNRQKIFQVFAGGQFRHHPAVFGMKLDLRGDDVGQDFTVAHNRGAGLVAGSFEGEEGHYFAAVFTGRAADSRS